MDLTATFLEAAGLRVPRDMDSRSLWPLLTGKARSHREFVLSGLNRWRAVWDGRYKLVTGFGPGAGKQGGGSGALLFDTETDPLENVNLAAERADLVERLRQLIPEPPRQE
jgi:arylsulfatase A-like enzyme